MKVPNRIYLANFEENPSELDRTWYYVKQVDCHNAEYIQTDAFIDKACEWLLNHNDYLENPYANVTSFNMAKLVADFRKAMEE